MTLADRDLLGKEKRIPRREVAKEIRDRFGANETQTKQIVKWFWPAAQKGQVDYAPSGFKRLQEFPAARSKEIYNAVKL